MIDAARAFTLRGGHLNRGTRRILAAFGDAVCELWSQPDEGIWEPRSGRRKHTHSRLLCWTALDRLIELHARGLLPRSPIERFARERAAIRQELAARAWNAERKSWVATLDGDEVDATLLLIAWYGFDDARSPRMRATWQRVRAELGCGDGLLYRYRNGGSPGEGAFGICSFWGAEYLGLGGGTPDEAARWLASLLRYGNDVGLFAEEIDPDSGAALGNFPQAFTHVGLINAAITLERRLRARVAAPVGARA